MSDAENAPLRVLRTASQMTQQQLADATGVAWRTIARWDKSPEPPLWLLLAAHQAIIRADLAVSTDAKRALDRIKHRLSQGDEPGAAWIIHEIMER